MITYNHEKFIAEAIEGVLMQDVDFEVELIIADDCSKDNSEEVIKSFIGNHPRSNWIKYIKHKRNLGMMANFVWALKQCRGSFVALCEGDDYWTDSNKLRNQVRFLMNNPDYSMSFHDANYVHSKIGIKFSEKYLFLNLKNVFSQIDLYENKWFIPTASILFRNFSVPDWLLNVSSGDFSLHLLLSKRGNFYYFPHTWSVYRIHSGGQGRVLNTYRNRLNDIRIWYANIPNLSILVLSRWYFSNWWRLMLASLLEK